MQDVIGNIFLVVCVLGFSLALLQWAFATDELWEWAEFIIRVNSFVIALASGLTGYFVSKFICKAYVYDAWYVNLPAYVVVTLLVGGLVFCLSILPYLVMYAIIHIAKSHGRQTYRFPWDKTP